jgi:hypothetical protein
MQYCSFFIFKLFIYKNHLNNTLSIDIYARNCLVKCIVRMWSIIASCCWNTTALYLLISFYQKTDLGSIVIDLYLRIYYLLKLQMGFYPVAVYY